MAKIFFEAGDTTLNIANNNTTVIGTGGDTDNVLIAAGVTGTTVDSTIEDVDFAGAVGDYEFKQGFGSNIEVYNAAGDLVATLASVDGKELSFSDGSVALTYADGKVSVGGEEISTTKAPLTNPTIDAADKSLVTGGASGGGKGVEFILTPGIDSEIFQDGNDTITGESATIGRDDSIIDTSISDHDVINLALTADMPAFKILNIEEVNVTLSTMGGTDIDATNISGATITVAADPAQVGFTGATTITSLGDNNAVAGEGITDLTANGIKGGLIDTGSATTLNATVATADTDSLNLKINGDVTLNATNAHKDLNVETTADATLTLTNTIFTENGIISGDSDLTVKTATTTFDTANDARVLENKGTGKLAIELSDTAKDVDLTKVDANDVILDVAFTKTIEFTDTLDVTAKAAVNKMELEDATPVGTGGSAGTTGTIHLTKVANADEYTFTDVDTSIMDIQQGGTIAKIDSDNLQLSTAKNLTVTALDAAGAGVLIKAESAGKIVIDDIKASAVVATGFTKDFTMTDTTDEQITVLGGTAANSITLANKAEISTVVTQDGKDTVTYTVADVVGKVTIDTKGGDDTVTIAMDTSIAKIDLGDGKDTATVLNKDGGELTLTALAGVDTVNVTKASAGTMTISTGDDNDIINVGYDGAGKAMANLTATANVTVNGEAGDDVINIDGADAETITVNGGDGTDVVEVSKDADFTDASLTLNTIENLKIDIKATFTDDQLNDQTFALSSGTTGVDVLHVDLDASKATDSANTTNLGDLAFSADSSTAVEYTDIDASASKSDDTIIGAHHTANIVKLGDGEDTVQLFADGVGTEILYTGGKDDKNADAGKMISGKHDDDTDNSFDIAVIEAFVSADDSLILGDKATADNYTELKTTIDAKNDVSGNGVEDVLAGMIVEANKLMGADADLAYVYTWNNGVADDGKDNAAGANTFLLWDSDGNHSVDSAIMLVGLGGDADGFAASDIIAG